jgi:hypothetical protein
VLPSNGNEEAVAELLAGAHRDGGGAPWLTSFVQRVLAGGHSELRVTSTVSPGRDEWNVEVTAGGVSLALIDVRLLTTDDPAALDAYLDSLTAKAMRRWNRMTRSNHSQRVRPWIACVTIGDDDLSREVARAADELGALVRQRILDLACVVQVAGRYRTISHPSTARSLDAFAAELIGRRICWSAMNLA